MGEASQTERVRQHQIAVAKSMGLPPAVLEVLGKVEDWKLREWLYICALDGFSVEKLGECAKGGTDVATLCRIREEFWQKRYARTDDLRKDVETLGREVRQASMESKAAREAVEAGVGEAMKRKEREHAEELRAKESAIRLLQSQVGKLEAELGRLKGDKAEPGGTGAVPEPGLKGTGTAKKEGEREVQKEAAGQEKVRKQGGQAVKERPDGQNRQTEQKEATFGGRVSQASLPRTLAERFLSRRREREARRFIDKFVTGGNLTAEQVDYLLECLEEGVSVREMERFAAPGVPVGVMRRLNGLQRKGG